MRCLAFVKPETRDAPSSGTIRENIVFGRPFNSAQLQRAIHAADFEHDVQTQAQGPPSPNPSEAFSLNLTRITTCYPYRVDSGPYFVPESPHIVAHPRRP